MRVTMHSFPPAICAPHLGWLGDFNLHHPMWYEGWNVQLFTRGNLDKSQYLIDALAELKLQMILPKDTPMSQALSSGNYRMLDNILSPAPSLTAQSGVACFPNEFPARTDHMPMVTDLNIRLET